ncbi:MAG: nitroreductase [Deltaproteobacteria bacterium]|nr:MAG: nitroreductase [Deltaproteobacteria bacterium]
MISLPAPHEKGRVSLEEAIAARRTVRSFSPQALTDEQLSQLLWATWGVIDPREGRKAIPSAGALYPLEVYVVVGADGVRGLEEGVYRYLSEEHSLERIAPGDRRREVAEASLWQMWMASAPVIFVIAAEYGRTTRKYGDRGVRYVLMEVGHAAQNLFLESVALGLGAGIVGAFYDDKVAEVLSLPERHEPLLIMPVGYPR